MQGYIGCIHEKVAYMQNKTIRIGDLVDVIFADLALVLCDISLGQFHSIRKDMIFASHMAIFVLVK